MEQLLPTTFEEERDDLLALYEASPAFHRTGDYTPEQFDGRCRTYLPKLKDLLYKYIQAYPHFRDVLGLELSRPRRASFGKYPAAYEFDGLMLPVRLNRRVNRLKLPAGATLFPALNPLYQHDHGTGALQQRSHFQWALKLAGQIAGSTTRDVLTFPLSSQHTPSVVSALQRLRAFGPADKQLEQAISDGPGLESWWEQCGMQQSRNALRTATRADHELAFEAYCQQNTPELLESVVGKLVEDAVKAKQIGQCPHGFSSTFYWKYFTCTVIPMEYHAPEIRICAAVAVLYQLADYDSNEQEKLQKTVKAEVLRIIEQLTSKAVPARQHHADVFFAQLNQQLQGLSTAERLKRHLAISRLSKHSSLIYSFYQAVGTYLDVQDIEESEWSDCLLELAHAMDTDASLISGREELATCAASICQQLYTGLNLSDLNDQRMLQRLYGLLTHCLPSSEVDTLEELILEQIAEEPASADQWLTENVTLAQRLRQHLRQRLMVDQTLFGSNEYECCARLLIAYTPLNETGLNHLLFARRYDVRYFMLT